MSETHSGTGAEAARGGAAGPGTGPAAGHVVVVGGGISGLAAAHRLAGAGARVTLVEASSRLGGKLHADEIAGMPVDLGAESILARRPEAVGLAREVGLGDDLEAPAVLGATVWTRGRLRPMPKGHVMGVPGDLGPLAASGVLSAAGLARLPLDHVLPRTEIDGDVAVGAYVAARLGHEVVDRLVEPLLGGVYAGNAYEISLRAAVPQLYAAARRGRSLIEAARGIQRKAAASTATGPVFNGIRGGIGRLPLAVAEACRAAGVVIETGAPVRELRRTGPHGWQVRLDDRAIDADAVVLAAPAPVAARLLGAESPAAAADLDSVDYASMALVTLAYRRSDLLRLPQSSGFLVPPVDGRTIKASTFSSRKWGWQDAAGGDTMVLRTSVGRYGDEADLAWDDADLVRLSREDLADAVGLLAAPVAARVTRWDSGLPQYPVGHVDRVARIREQVAKLPGLAVCGALYDGVGIPACVGSGQRAAAEVLATLVPAGQGGAGE
ncbi:protoporphyrinogen oxidase [Streptomyces cocklensis]|uniref:Coproporphyrinogen III oxidase n=1 Tax=Actinacidiphila cocklensis TaxID=887465 RepID=A0A9W4GTQ5_9ACTN|nr:protoporphyrinogen oxidase [Actinacidiphila cocklensis]MDD1059489.1 protoporphyrinogen oxidase [Actinacidiphila cocklensis]CAG6397303.1 Coproporphyrinogen III oxidase [Actinacidiphila cocklensis]